MDQISTTNLGESFTVADAAKRAGIETQKVSNYLFNGLVIPEIHVGNSSGDPHLMSIRNVNEIVLIELLNRWGAKPSVIKKIITTLKNSSLNWWESGGWIVGFANLDFFITDNLFGDYNKEFLKENEPLFIIRIKTV